MTVQTSELSVTGLHVFTESVITVQLSPRTEPAATRVAIDEIAPEEEKIALPKASTEALALMPAEADAIRPPVADTLASPFIAPCAVLTLTGSASSVPLVVITALPSLIRKQAAVRLPDAEISPFPAYIAIGAAVTLAAAFTLPADSLTLNALLETIAEPCTAPLPPAM
jgi:hypothetical protein